MRHLRGSVGVIGWRDWPQAIEQIVAELQAGKRDTVLLGVTGSGKTEIYLQAIDRVLEHGLGVGNRQREGLLAQHVLAGVEGTMRPLGVQMVRQRVVDRIDGRVRQQRLVRRGLVRVVPVAMVWRLPLWSQTRLATCSLLSA